MSETTIHTNKPTLVAVAISRNEEVDLPGFIEHLVDWVDEIIIIDDGSDDATKRIALEAGPKVKFIEQTMGDDGFSGQRNRGIEAASSDWLLHMDIDERVPSTLADEILSVIQTDTFSAYRYRRLNFFLHRPMRGGGFQDWNNPQLARRGNHRFENVIHEACIVEGAPNSIGQLKEKIWHLNDNSYKERMEKSFTYCQNQARRLEQRGIKVKWYHLLLFPVGEFLRKYVKRAGYKDGLPGLLWALHTACAMFRATALLWDEQNPADRHSVEDQISSSYKK